uniref:Heteropteran venom family 3 protein 1 n=1 Tax=Oncocephalus sp. TaxID=2944721 RepID=A0AB38ZEL8_9HEMI
MAITNILTASFIALVIALFVPIPVKGDLFGSDCGNNKTHNFKFGDRGFFDKLLYSSYVKAEGSWLRKISKDVTYPPTGKQPIGYITYMEALDQYNDGNGGCAFLKAGGVGQNMVTFHIKSQRSQGFNFKINIYGLDNACVAKLGN